jgi:hypothetical protein
VEFVDVESVDVSVLAAGVVSNVQAVKPAFVTNPVGHELNHVLSCSNPGLVQAVHVVLSPVQVDHPPWHDNQLPVIFTNPDVQSDTHVVPSSNKAPTQVKQVVILPVQVAHGEVHASQDVEDADLRYPVGQSLKHWVRCKIGNGLEHVVQVVVVLDQVMQLPAHACHMFDIATNPVPQSLMHVLLLKFKSPLQVRQFAAVVLQVAHVLSHAMHVVPLV